MAMQTTQSQHQQSHRSRRADQPAVSMITSQVTYATSAAAPHGCWMLQIGPVGDHALRDGAAQLAILDRLPTVVAPPQTPVESPARRLRSYDGEELGPIVPPVQSALPRQRPVARPQAVRTRPARTRSDQRLRLTLRGQIAVVLLIAGLVGIGSATLNLAQSPAVAQVTVQVQPGDSAQSIAKEHAHGRDQAALAQQIIAANGLPADAGVALVPGQLLIVPGS